MIPEHYANEDVEKVLLNRDEIESKVKELAGRISKDYKNKNLLAVGILRGSVVFLADLMRHITIPMELDFMSVSSYNAGAVSSGNVKIKLDLECDLTNKDVLIVEDIIDTGHTLKFLTELFQKRKASSVEICCFLDKPERRLADVPVKYIGFSVPDEFLIGYGLDYAEKYRNIGSVAVLKRSVYE